MPNITAASHDPDRAEARRRWVRVIKATTLVLGAILANLTVAWACAAWSPIRSTTDLPEWQCPGYPDEWPGGPYGEYGWWSTEEGFGYRQYSDWSARGGDGNFSYWTNQFIRYRQVGWPMLAFQSTVFPYHADAPPYEPTRWQLPVGIIFHRGIPTNDLPPALGAHAEGRLPLVPMGWGFLVNTVFYGLIILGLWHFGIHRPLTRRRNVRQCTPERQSPSNRSGEHTQ